MNRKYIQLTVEDLVELRRAVIGWCENDNIRWRITTAIDEAITCARETPNASICLARAVERKNR
jgi:hypothetical protein